MHDTTYLVDFAYLMCEQDDAMRVEHDRHVFGLFARNDWLRLLQEVGFEARTLRDPFDHGLFVGVRPEKEPSL